MTPLPQNPNRLDKRVAVLEAKNRELAKKVRDLEARLEEVAQNAAEAYREAESAAMWHRPIGG